MTRPFPLFFALIPAQKLPAVERAVGLILDGAASDGVIYNVEFKDAKDCLNRALYDAYRLVESSAQPVRDSEEDRFSWEVRVSYVNDLTTAHKKLTNTKVTGAFVTAARAFVAELLPLATAAAACRAKAIKGRKPSGSPAKPVNLDKIVKTCPCCFRPIAIGDGKMVLHGYRRPGDGHTQGQCFGVNFLPLEESTAGLEAYIENREEKVRFIGVRLAQADGFEAITVPKWGNGRREPVTVKRGEQGFDAALAAFKDDLNWELRGVKSHLRTLRAKLAERTSATA